MTGKEYTELALRTRDPYNTFKLKNLLKLDSNNNVNIAGVIEGTMGMTGEAGEVSDIVKKYIFHQKPIDHTHLKREIGDVMWYIALLCSSLGYNLDDIMRINIDKLKARYPEGFDIQRANNKEKNDV